MSLKFTKQDLGKIKRNTNYNNHTVNYIFIAHKINSKLEDDFKKIEKNNTKGLNSETADRQYHLYQVLMDELKEKYPDDYEKVYSRL